MTDKNLRDPADLCTAAFKGDIPEMRHILAENPAAIDATYIDMNVMAHALSSPKRAEVVEFLVNGAGLTPEQLQKLWRHEPKDCHQLHIACIDNRADIADTILQYDKSQLNTPSKTNENTVLMRVLAMGANASELVGVLLKHGADVSMIDALGNTCLHHAAFGNLETLKPHFERFEDQLNVRNNAKRLPLHHTLFRDTPDMTDFLFGKGTDIKPEDRDEDLFLLEQCFEAKEKALKNAIVRGIDTVQNGTKQKTPIMRKIVLRRTP